MIPNYFSALPEFTYNQIDDFDLNQQLSNGKNNTDNKNIIQNQNQINQNIQSQLQSQNILITPKQNSIVDDTRKIINIIESNELVDLIDQISLKYEQDTQQFDIPNIKIFDCRWPYEYDGGHILTSVNTFKGQQLKKQLTCDQQVLNYAIFYCEYSQVRARKMYFYCEQLQQNNIINTKIERILLLNNGFRDFYNKYPEYVQGQYVQERSNLQLQQYYSHDSQYDMDTIL